MEKGIIFNSDESISTTLGMIKENKIILKKIKSHVDSMSNSNSIISNCYRKAYDPKEVISLKEFIEFEMKKTFPAEKFPIQVQQYSSMWIKLCNKLKVFKLSNK